jgi:hypothetical protein
VLILLPRYLTAPGCPDPEHASNRLQEFYRKTIIGRLERLKKSIRDFLLSSGIRNLKILAPLWLMAGPKTADADLQACIDVLWDEDPVHPTEEGYKRLLDGLRKMVAEESAKTYRTCTGNASSKIARPEWCLLMNFTPDQRPRGGGPTPTRRGGGGWHTHGGYRGHGGHGGRGGATVRGEELLPVGVSSTAAGRHKCYSLKCYGLKRRNHSPVISC